MSTLHEEIKIAYAVYLKEHESFQDKGVKAAAPRARSALLDLMNLAKERRKEIQTQKSEM